MEGNGYATAAGVMSSGRAEVETSVGKVLVQRLSMSELAQMRGQLLDLQGMIPDAGSAASTEVLRAPQADQAEQAVWKAMCLAVLAPRLTMDPEQGPTPRDFSEEDRAAIMTKVLALSGFTRQAAEAVRP